MTHTAPTVERAAPSRTLAILALGAMAYALAQTMIIPALPSIQEDYGATQEPSTWLLTIFLLTSSVATPLLGRLGDMYGKEKILLVRARRLRPRLAHLRARQLDRRAHPRPRRPGRRRRDLPAGLRHHPRRVPARARRLVHRPHLLDLRHRRRRRARLRRPARRPPLRPVDLLVLAGLHGDRGGGDLALRPRVPRPGAGPHRLRRRRPADDPAGGRPARRLPGQRLGLGLRPRSRAVRLRRGVHRGLRRLREARGGPDRRHGPHARAGRVVHEPRRVRGRLRDVRLLHPHPPACRGVEGHGVRLRAVDDSARAWCCCPAPW